MISYELAVAAGMKGQRRESAVSLKPATVDPSIVTVRWDEVKGT
jgi:hypothetical protein